MTLLPCLLVVTFSTLSEVYPSVTRFRIDVYTDKPDKSSSVKGGENNKKRGQTWYVVTQMSEISTNKSEPRLDVLFTLLNLFDSTL